MKRLVLDNIFYGGGVVGELWLASISPAPWQMGLMCFFAGGIAVMLVEAWLRWFLDRALSR